MASLAVGLVKDLLLALVLVLGVLSFVLCPLLPLLVPRLLLLVLPLPQVLWLWLVHPVELFRSVWNVRDAWCVFL